MGGGLPLGTLPGMIPSKVIFGYLHEGILLTWRKYVSCFTRIYSIDNEDMEIQGLSNCCVSDLV